MSIGFWQILLIVFVVMILFGRGRIANVMGEIGKGVRSMREGLKGDEEKKEDNQ